MTKYLPFVFDDNGYLTNQKCFIITGEHVEYLSAFLNSSLFRYCFIDAFPKLSDDGRELSKIFFDKIPVLKVSDQQNEIFRTALKDIQQDYNKSKAIAIDTMVFDLYNLSEDDRQIIGYIEIE